MANPNPLNITFTAPVICNFPHKPIITHHASLAFMIPILLGFRQIQGMGNNNNGQSPFQVSPVTTMASVMSIVACYMAFGYALRFPTYASQLGVVMAVSGSLSVASLVSLLHPHSWWCIRYIFYVLLFVGELYQMVQNLYWSYVYRFKKRYSPPHVRRRVPPLLLRTLMDLALD